MVMNSELRELSFKQAAIGTIRAAAIRAGMKDLLHDGKIKILKGDGTEEEFDGSSGEVGDVLLLGGGFDMFDVGDLNVFTSLTTYTNPTDGGRIRLTFDGRVTWKFISDFNLGFTIIERYDSRPPSPGAAKRDFQYSLTFGWSWS